MNISRHVPNLISVARIIATPILVYLAASLSILSNIEELIIVALLPTWTSDVRGLYWILERQRFGTA